MSYMGQGSLVNSTFRTKLFLNVNPFYEIMPHWFLLIGIGIATLQLLLLVRL